MSSQMRNVCLVNVCNERTHESEMATLKLGTTSTFVTSINWTLPLSPVRRAKRPTTGNSNSGRNSGGYSNAAATTNRTSRERANAGWAERRGEPQCWRNERKKDFSRRLHAALSFSRDSPSVPFRPPFPCPAFSCKLARRVHGEQTGFAIKRILSWNVQDQWEDLTYSTQTGSRSFHFSLRVLFLLSPPARIPRPVISSFYSCSSLFLPSPFVQSLSWERYALPLARWPEWKERRKKGLQQLRVVRKVRLLRCGREHLKRNKEDIERWERRINIIRWVTMEMSERE